MTGGKTHHGKAKHQSKKSKGKQRSAAGFSTQTITHAVQPAVAASVSAPLKKSHTTNKVRATTAASRVRYPYVTAELKRIGILAGIMLAILVVLALVLS